MNGYGHQFCQPVLQPQPPPPSPQGGMSVPKIVLVGSVISLVGGLVVTASAVVAYNNSLQTCPSPPPNPAPSLCLPPGPGLGQNIGPNPNINSGTNPITGQGTNVNLDSSLGSYTNTTNMLFNYNNSM